MRVPHTNICIVVFSFLSVRSDGQLFIKLRLKFKSLFSNINFWRTIFENAL